jgi:hypothetical protein
MFKTVSQAKMLFENGALITARIIDYQMEFGYEVVIIGKDRAYSINTQRDDKRAKIYKSYQAAVNDLKEIGFNTSKLELIK